jgi:hypothetical protein
MWKTFCQVLAELKKQPREVPLPPMHTVRNVPHYTSPDSPPLVTGFTSAAVTARPGASRPPQTRRHGGRRAKRQQQARARALAAQEAGGGEATAAGRETRGKSETMSNSPGLSAVSTVSPLSDAIEAAALAAALGSS